MIEHIAIATLDDDELQHAALLARACLLIASARAYGFIEGGDIVDVERCEDVLAAARDRLGYIPSDEDAELAAIHLIVEHNERVDLG